MRNIILILLTFSNIVVILMTQFYQVGIDYLSLRILLVAFSSIISAYLILLYRTRVQLWLAIISLALSLFHIIMIIRTIYTTLYP
ncbi:hypothetical protein DOS70_07690 [Staphylococcus felis]|uniref:Sensor histidine kinase n=1 Tax=Staphylococcus felis TaxID=46127 RepID=A0A2K3ZGI2_9STAP|nr:hypothetical protein [Staphylococcus felis]AVP36485.1 hypothetical protein C7J90_05810 [Staphylococcus felis]MBH9581662.1 hypothetical protein [Staphylococcus felis]MDM8326787.1 hypothetical protein [Staphylococcus felis]MDQ7192123.1 hypothetical protein [Staphylococcus felis]PNZ36969.1 hypothetical protein CD143_02875 [Staphylococcus felis]